MSNIHYSYFNLKQISRVASLLAIVVGTLVLIGWSANILVLLTAGIDTTTMKANTALCFILGGISLGLQQKNKQRSKTIARASAIAVFLIGLLTLSQYLSGWNLGIDELLFRDPTSDIYPGRMGDNTALNFILLGAALWLLGQHTRRSDWIAQLLTLFAASISLLALVGYLYDVQVFYQFVFFSTSMAFHTALMFIALSGGILCGRIDRGIMQIFVSDLDGSIVARRLIPIAILLPIFLGWLLLLGQRSSFYDSAFSLALLVVLLVVIFVVAIGWTAKLLDEIDRDRKQAELQLKTQTSQLEQSNAALIETTAQLTKSNRDLERFVYIASHDLKAPLRAISSLSTWLEEDLQGQLSEENQRHLELLRGRVHRMDALLDGLLAYSRVGRQSVPTEMTDVGQLLSEVIASLAPPAGFIIKISSSMPTFVTKRMLLAQVFSHLISNAIKHHPSSHGQIEISALDKGKYYEFAVTDDGSGIALEYREKIFVIFQTLKARDVQENTGIGLSIVKKILETEGGEIFVESDLGKGTTFRFTWPNQ
jgi:signal transduction histidine kinase